MKHTITTGPTIRASARAATRVATFGLTAAAALVGAPAAPQRDAAQEPQDCINLMEIDRTRVADENTILFYMRGGDVYRNDLPNRCPNLRYEQRFMYRVTLNRLCDSDVVTVIDDVGFGFMPGATCGLGKFEPISEEEAEALAPRRERRRDRD